VPSLRSLGWRFRPEWAPGDPRLVGMARLMAPATVGLGAVQVNIFVNSWFASQHSGAVSWLDYAFRLLYLPIGLFGVALGTIATAGLARSAAAGDMEGLRLTLRQSLSMLAYLTLPATVGLMVLGEPIVRLLYEHRAFRPEDTPPTAQALFLYSFGLVGYTGVKVLAPAFYALGRARVPLVGSISAVATNLAFVWLGYPRFGFRAIAVGTALGSLLNAALLVVSFERRVGGLRGHGLLAPIARMAGAALVMGVAAWTAAYGLELRLGTHGIVARSLEALVPVVIGVGLYVLTTRVLRVGETDVLWRMLRSRLRGGAGSVGAAP
jgi:putative peptidoglycan lipid II flippase